MCKIIPSQDLGLMISIWVCLELLLIKRSVAKLELQLIKINHLKPSMTPRQRDLMTITVGSFLNFSPFEQFNCILQRYWQLQEIIATFVDQGTSILICLRVYFEIHVGQLKKYKYLGPRNQKDNSFNSY